MATTSTDYASIAQTFDNETLTSVHYTNVGQPALRDSDGNLREITEAETAFAAAVSAEFYRRFGH